MGIVPFWSFLFKKLAKTCFPVVVPKSGEGQVLMIMIFTEDVRWCSITNFCVIWFFEELLKFNFFARPRTLRKDSSEEICWDFPTSFWWSISISPWSFALNTDFKRYYCIYFFISISVPLFHLFAGCAGSLLLQGGFLWAWSMGGGTGGGGNRGRGGLNFRAVHRLLFVVASLAVGHRL